MRGAGIDGGAGVTGGMIVQFAALAGAEVAATAGPRSAARVRRLGAAHVIDYHDRDWPARARAALGGPAAAAANAVVGGVADALAVVADGGRLASIAGPAPDRPGGVAPPGQYCRGITTRTVFVQPGPARPGSAGPPPCWPTAPCGWPSPPSTRWPRRPAR
jgi:NADPH:quinone reductase-like Zn-dependent oxidoreductase